MKQLTARHPMSGTTIIERFIDGIRYMKVTPIALLPMIQEKLKQQFQENMEIEVSENGWIKIKKLKSNEKLEKQLKEKIGDTEVNEDYILNKEAEMLKKVGYIVTIEEIK